MSIIEFCSELRNRGIKLWLEGDSLKYQAPKGVMTQELLGEISQRKDAIRSFLKQVSDGHQSISEVILKAGRNGQDIPLSFSQQALWFFDQLTPGNPVYNIPNAVRIKGELDMKAMESALNVVIERHEILRTTFAGKDGKPFQVIAPEFRVALKMKDFQGYQGLELEQKIREALEEEAWMPFNLKDGPLWRLNLFRMGEKDYVIAFTIHHIISDAWSNGIFINELFKGYEAFRASIPGISGIPLDLPPLPVQFADYAHWQRRRFANQEFVSPLVAYWMKQLSKHPPLELPTDHPRPLAQSFRGRTLTILLQPERVHKIKERCITEEVTLFVFFLASWVTLLYRYSGQEDILVGTVVANRNQIELTGLIGFIMNTLVLRNEVSAKLSFKELLQRVKNVTLDAFTHQELPFDLLLEELKPERDISRTPLFQVMYIHQNPAEVKLQIEGLDIEPLEVENKAAPFDLRLITQETREGIICRLDYCTALYEDATIARMLEHYQNIIQEAVGDISREIGKLSILSSKERRQILEDFNDTAVPYPTDCLIHRLFEKQVEKAPDTIAVIFEGASLTYSVLNQRANQLAHYLRSCGVGPDITVGVCLERSLEMVISLLGILKAGGAYVPFDPHYPRDRVNFMIENAKVKVLITMESLIPEISTGGAQLLCLDKNDEKIRQQCAVNLDSGVSKDNLAYIIYTSGSTGMPKGAINTHLGLCNHKLWMQDAYKLTPNDRVLQKTPFSFDVSVWEFFWPLITGARLVVAKPEGHKDPRYLIKTIMEQGITTIHFVPSMLYAFLEQPEARNCTGLKRVFCSGEALNIDLLNKFRGIFDIPIHNVYGPAECSDVSTAWTYEGQHEVAVVPIGRPISNVRVYILDKFLNPVPLGVTGELYVGGISVGKGYINNPTLTAERFMLDPFSSAKEAKMYKTGDLARFLSDGNIEYRGRIDFQVKIRGVRIELGEIEKSLAENPAVKGNAVIAWEKDNGNQYLVAYIVPQDGIAPDINEVRKSLRNKLPEYMVPSLYVFVERLPLNPNGKLDRKALPAPDIASASKNSNYVAPQNEIEKTLADIWKEVIGVDEIGVHDNFFEIGGHSLLLVQVHSRMKEVFKRDFPLLEMFTYPTISALAAFVTGEPDKPVMMQNEERLHKQKQAKLKRKELNRRGA